MTRRAAWVIGILLLMPGAAADAEPITLKLSFFSSDRTVAYQAAVKPFVDAVNREGSGLMEIVVYPSGTLGRAQRDLPKLVRDGTADIAFITPGRNPELFIDNAVVELPGLFRNVREGTLTYSHLVATGKLAGYQDFQVIGVFATPPQIINSRKPIRALADLNGQKIRVNNKTEGTAMAKLGAVPVVLAFNETGPALARGELDGATVAAAQLFDTGIGRFTSHHYLLGTGSAPVALLMNRKVFDALPEPAKSLIRRYSGEWAARSYIEAYEALDKTALAELEADSRRTTVVPSPADQTTAARAFRSVVDEWAAASAHNRELLSLAEAELAKVRSTP